MRKFILMACILLVSACATTERTCRNSVGYVKTGIEKSFAGTAIALGSDMIDADTADNLATSLKLADSLAGSAYKMCPVDERHALNLIAEAGGMLAVVEDVLKKAGGSHE